MTEEIKDIIEAEKEYNASQIQVLEGLDQQFGPAPSGL